LAIVWLEARFDIGPYSESSFIDKSASKSGIANQKAYKPLLEALLSLKEDSKYGPKKVRLSLSNLLH